MAVIITGVNELRLTMEKHKNQIELKTVRRMVAAGAGVLRKEAKNIARTKGLKRTGAMIRNIAIKRERRTPPGVTQYNVGVRHGRALGKRHAKYLAIGKSGRIVTRRENDPFYWRFLEAGTKYIQAHNFIRDSLVNKRAEAIRAMTEKLRTEIRKINQK